MREKYVEQAAQHSSTFGSVTLSTKMESYSCFPSATTTASNGQLTNAVFGCVVLPSELITVTQ